MRLLVPTLLLLAFAPAAGAQDLDTRLYGKVTTGEGDVYEGLIRWDKNEVGWLDVLDGSKRVRSSTGSGRRNTRTRTSGVRFGHLKSLENGGRNQARLTLRSGEEVTFSAGSTDIGSDVREIIVEDAHRGVVELRWRDLNRIDFSAARNASASQFGERLYGTLETADGATHVISWDDFDYVRFEK